MPFAFSPGQKFRTAPGRVSWAVFENVVRGTLLDAFNRGFFSPRPGHQKKGDVPAGFTQLRERFQARRIRKAIVGEDRVEILLQQRAAKLLLIFRQCVIQMKSGFPEFRGV